LIGAWLINPPLVLVVLAAAVLEVAYCLLLKVTYWRTLISGLVKSCGPVAAVFEVQPTPSLPLLGLMVAWIMLWEIGGQNIPADWNDIEEDRHIGARTIPLVLGPRRAGWLVVITLILAVITSLFLPRMSPLHLGPVYLVFSALAGLLLLVWPAIRLLRTGASWQAARLFDRASHYPLVQLALIAIFVLLAQS
jgi:4-hydroxybenzoate polyprenyltransferase